MTYSSQTGVPQNQKSPSHCQLATGNRPVSRCCNVLSFCGGKYVMEQDGQVNSSLGFFEDGVKIPTDYMINAEQALAYDHEAASNYLRHTLISDPYMDQIFETLADLPSAELVRFIQAGMEQDREGMTGALQALRDFFIDMPPADPPWLDYEAFVPGIRAFHRNSGLILSGFAAGVPVDGFTTYIAKSFVLTGRVMDNGVRRLRQNNRHFLDIFYPGGLARNGDGWKLTVRIRLIHAQMRRLLNTFEEWDNEAWGFGERSAPGLRRRLHLRADHQALGVGGGVLHSGRAGQHHGRLALHRLHHGYTGEHTLYQ